MNEIPVYKFALVEELKNNSKFLPTKAEPDATGWDVRSAVDITIRPFEYAKIKLGIRGFCPKGWWYELKCRSSSFTKKNLHSLYGTIDETWEGELLFACQFIPEKHKPDLDLVINFGEAIGQIIPVKRQEMIVESISNEEYDHLCKERNGVRGIGGFGSTSA